MIDPRPRILPSGDASLYHRIYQKLEFIFNKAYCTGFIREKGIALMGISCWKIWPKN
jgi:hypothetical protein